jgi:hypothetical protein
MFLRSTVAGILLFSVSAVTLAVEPEWTEFTSKEGKYTITFPGKPEPLNDGGTVKHYVVTNDGAYMTGVSILSADAVQSKTPDKILDEGRDSLVREKKAKVLDEKKITLGDARYPGRDMLVEWKEDGELFSYRVRAYVVKNRLYQLIVGGKSDFTKSKDADKFLDSFKLNE